MEIKRAVARFHLSVELRQAVQDIAFKLWHIARLNALVFLEVRQCPQHIAHRIAQASVAVRHPLKDFRPDPLIGSIICLSHPKPQNIRAILLDDLFRNDGIAK